MPSPLAQIQQRFKTPDFKDYLRASTRWQQTPGAPNPGNYMQYLNNNTPIHRALQPTHKDIHAINSQGVINTPFSLMQKTIRLPNRINYHSILDYTGNPEYFQQLKKQTLKARKNGWINGIFTPASVDTFIKKFNPHAFTVYRKPLPQERFLQAVAINQLNERAHKLGIEGYVQTPVNMAFNPATYKTQLNNMFNAYTEPAIVPGMVNKVLGKRQPTLTQTLKDSENINNVTSGSPTTIASMISTPASNRTQQVTNHELNHTYTIGQRQNKNRTSLLAVKSWFKGWADPLSRARIKLGKLFGVPQYAHIPVEVSQSALAANQGRQNLRKRILENPAAYQHLGKQNLDYITKQMPNFWQNKKQADNFAHRVIRDPRLFNALPVEARRYYGNYNSLQKNKFADWIPFVRNIKKKFHNHWWLANNYKKPGTSNTAVV